MWKSGTHFAYVINNHCIYLQYHDSWAYMAKYAALGSDIIKESTS